MQKLPRKISIVPGTGDTIESIAEAMVSFARRGDRVVAQFDGIHLAVDPGRNRRAQDILVQYEKGVKARRLSPNDRIEQVAQLINEFVEFEGGDHHTRWLFDQILRILLADTYPEWVSRREQAIRIKDDPDYVWNVGVAP